MAIPELQVSHCIKKWTYFNLTISMNSHLKRHETRSSRGTQAASQGKGAEKRVMPSSKGSLGVMGLEKSPGVQSMDLNDQIHNQGDKL